MKLYQFLFPENPEQVDTCGHTLNLRSVKKISCTFYEVLFMEIWSFETINCLNSCMQRQKRHDVTFDVKVNFLICGFVGCLRNMLFLDIYFFIILCACVQ